MSFLIPHLHFLYSSRIFLFLIILLFIPLAATAACDYHNQAGNSHKNGTSWDYVITIPEGDGPCGIIENIPVGFLYQSSNIPTNQVREIKDHVFFSLPKEEDLTFTITGKKRSTGLLSGTYTDFLTRDVTPLLSLQLSEGRIKPVEALQPDTSPLNDKKESSGFTLFFTTIALVVVAGLFSQRKR